ncbi:ribose 5-phosphate isomerase B [Caldanaerobius fijiensis DSM 17918]|uniref:Ribose 5-phosphate isomerase B n=1 Tax=Caldanaerobius fijiensis DSM 17918 TaxID=1121256 RepID=A0A1M4UPJ6_9THEO|nr:ribose 5-phosphate isomerase B [Caldanaerobius fijiensis]SHE58568.1 ribose 5-phosphate isomerase B [Caldanaerobius fijiensis DSM 17918]
MIALGADHGGYELKEEIKKYLMQKGYEVKDFGTFSEEPVDYPDMAEKVGEAIISGQCDRGILCCGTGIGISIAANKIHGIRAANCSDSYSARMAKEHNNANVLCLGGRVVGKGLAIMIVEEWLNARFQGERHQRRIDKIAQLEKKY